MTDSVEEVNDDKLALLDEIADGAWGDNPMVRGKARDEAIRLRANLSRRAIANTAGEGVSRRLPTVEEIHDLLVLYGEFGSSNGAHHRKADECAGEILKLFQTFSALVSPPAGAGEPVAWQWSDFSGNWYTVDTNLSRMSASEQEGIALACAATHAGRVRPLYAVTHAPEHNDAREVTVTDAMVETAHRAQMGELFLRCQPNNGDVFSFMDDRKDVMRAALTAALGKAGA